MHNKQDAISDAILKFLETSKEPLETKEIEQYLKKVTRIKTIYRLNNLRGNGLIKGKFVGPGKGVWIWWHPNLFNKEAKK